MTTIRLKAGLPTGDANGLEYHAADFVDNPDKLRLALALLDTKAVTEDRDTGDTTATARIRRIELVTRDDDTTALQRIMLRANEERKGGTVLPYDTEQAVSDVFKDFAAGPEGDIPPCEASE